MQLRMHDKDAIYYNEETIRYDQLLEAIDRYSIYFKAYKGKHIALFCENRPEWIYVLYGAWQAGCVVVPIDTLSVADEVAYILKDCDPTCIVSSNKNLPVLNEAIKKAKVKLPLFNVDKKLPAAKGKAPLYSVRESDLLLILYTSGTTGGQKGVMLTKKNIETNVRWNNDSKRINETDVLIALLPLHHSWPLIATALCPLDAGASIVIVGELTAENLTKTMVARKVTMVTAVPRLFDLLHRSIMAQVNKKPLARIMLALCKGLYKIPFERYIFGRVKFPYCVMDVSPLCRALFGAVHKKFGGNVKVFISGGAKLDNAIIRDFRAMGITMLEGYGLTETAPMVTYHPFDAMRIGSAGCVFDDIDVRIKDGEIQLKGPNVMKGYYKKPKETKAAFDEGYFMTGDLGYMDKKRYLYITGRKKDLIVLSNGKNIRPDLLEKKLIGLSGLIGDAAVFERSKKLFAVVIPDMKFVREQNIANINEAVRTLITDAFNTSVESYKRIKDFLVTSVELPRSRKGDIKRFRLNEFVDARSVKTAAVKKEKLFEEYNRIAAKINELCGVQPSPDSHLELDIGLDSLSFVELSAWIEQNFGISLGQGELAKFATLRELAQHVRDHKSKKGDGDVEWKELLETDPGFEAPKKKWMINASSRLFSLLFGGRVRISAVNTDLVPDGACIIAPNHTSFLDSLAVYRSLSKVHRNELYFFANSKHFKSPFLKYYAKRSHIVLLDINANLHSSLRSLASLLREGKKVVIFPEGTRTGDGSLGIFKKSFAAIAKAVNVPVVPVAIAGAWELMPRGKKLPGKGKITVTFTKPIFPAKLPEEKIIAAARKAIVDILG